MCDLREGYKYIYCPTHKTKKLGQVKEDAIVDGQVLVFCSLCKHVVEVKNKPSKPSK